MRDRCLAGRAVLAIVVLGSSSGVLPRGAAAQSQRRTIEVPVDLRRATWVTRDTTGAMFASPNKAVLVRDLLVITDPTGRSVVALDSRTGAVRWRYARSGRGPAELWSPQIASAHPAGVLLADNGTARLHLLGWDGSHIDEMPVPGGQFVTGLCSLRDSTILLAVAAPLERAVIAVRLGSTSVRSLGAILPSATGSLSDGAIDLSAGQGARSCFASRKIQDGLALVAARGTLLQASFVEPVRQRPLQPPSAIRDTSDLPIPFSLKNGFDGRHLYTWFGGVSCLRRCVDLYDPSTLKYQGSLRLTGRSGLALADLVLTSSSVILLGTIDDSFIIAALPRTGKPQ